MTQPLFERSFMAQMPIITLQHDEDSALDDDNPSVKPPPPQTEASAPRAYVISAHDAEDVDWPFDEESSTDQDRVLHQERQEQCLLIENLSLLKPLFENHKLAIFRSRVINLSTELTYGTYMVFQRTLNEAGFEMVVLQRRKALWPRHLGAKDVPFLLSAKPEDLKKAIDRYEAPLYLWSNPHQRFNEDGGCEIVLSSAFMAHHRLCSDWLAMVGDDAESLTPMQCECLLQLPFNERELALLAAVKFWEFHRALPEDFTSFMPEECFLPVNCANEFILDLQSIAESLFKAWHQIDLCTVRVGYDTHVGHVEMTNSTQPTQFISIQYEILTLNNGEFQVCIKTAARWDSSALDQLVYLCNEANQTGDGGCHYYEVKEVNLAVTSLYLLQLRQVSSYLELDKRLLQLCLGYLKFFNTIVQAS